MKVVGQLHVQVAIHPGKESPISIVQEAGWAPNHKGYLLQISIHCSYLISVDPIGAFSGNAHRETDITNQSIGLLWCDIATLSVCFFLISLKNEAVEVRE
jgi:hypothetical protein